jgi:hypothetical protein
MLVFSVIEVVSAIIFIFLLYKLVEAKNIEINELLVQSTRKSVECRELSRKVENLILENDKLKQLCCEKSGDWEYHTLPPTRYEIQISYGTNVDVYAYYSELNKYFLLKSYNSSSYEANEEAARHLVYELQKKDKLLC